MKRQSEGEREDRLAEKEEETTGSSDSFFVAQGSSRIRLFKEVPSKEKKRNPLRGRCPF